MNLLMVIDMQNDFGNSKGSLYVPEGEKIIPTINKLIEIFHQRGDLVVATKDYHPTNHISFASTHAKKPFSTIKMAYGEQVLWPDHCVENTWGQKFVTGLATKYIEQTFYKGKEANVEMYSIVQDAAQNIDLAFELFLQRHQFEKIYLVGLAFDYCVRYTAHDLFALKHDVNIILPAVKAIEGDKAAALVKTLQAEGIKIMTEIKF